ncbi:MAG: DUF1674 domain-containing protein [Rhodospirillaceae bacterium]|nr:DUF1674 domain-containing protein [Rhodospirillaceae bacterium]|tara:strand:- start:999 stop:1163 length:165 start_codon:yes stop_codon:yes gene_type:complete
MSENKLQKITSNDKKKSQNKPKENGASLSDDEKKKSLDPTRYGDWEVKGIAVDF